MHSALCAAAAEAGATSDNPKEATGLIWADPAAADRFDEVAATLPNLEWIQLPYAGIEPFVDHLDARFTWTCGKGVYAAPVAEHALALALAGLRNVHNYASATSWGGPVGTNLLDAPITIIGAGGIAESLIDLLAPFNSPITVVRRSDRPLPGAHRTMSPAQLHEAVVDAMVVFVAAASTPETSGLVDADVLGAMRSGAWLVNVARGGLIDTDALVTALDSRAIGGAALDVTDPEPLPSGHPLWAHPACIITPHVGNTPEMGLPLLVDRVRENVERWIAGRPLVGLVEVEAGY